MKRQKIFSRVFVLAVFTGVGFGTTSQAQQIGPPAVSHPKHLAGVKYEDKKTNTSSGGKQQYYQVQMNNVYISGRQQSGSNTNIHPPTTTGLSRQR
jgi:hypothetical protein